MSDHCRCFGGGGCCGCQAAGVDTRGWQLCPGLLSIMHHSKRTLQVQGKEGRIGHSLRKKMEKQLNRSNPRIYMLKKQEWFKANHFWVFRISRPETMIQLLDALGDTSARTIQHENAAAYHRAALQQKQRAAWPPAEMVASYSALATDAMNLFQLEEALDWVRQAEALPLPNVALAILYQQEARLLECKDDYISALHVFEHSLKLQDSNGVPEVLQHMDYLKQVLVSHDVPSEVAGAIQSRISQMSNDLIRKGVAGEGQFPKRYVSGLRPGKPWQSFKESAWMEKADVATRAATAELLEEYYALKEAGKMSREQECIHSHRGGQWSRFEINALNWHSTDSAGIRCAVESPRACALFRKLSGFGMPLIRAGYSAVSAGAWLKPHHGTTNAQLKWHLGLLGFSWKNVPFGLVFWGPEELLIQLLNFIRAAGMRRFERSIPFFLSDLVY